MITRQNLGTYVSITGFFTGLGLLIGSYIVSRNQKDQEVVVEAVDIDISPPKVEIPNEQAKTKKPSKNKKDIKTSSRAKTSEKLEEAIARMEQNGRQLTQVQRQLVLSGVITPEDMLKQLDFKEEDEPDYVDYQKPLSVLDVPFDEDPEDDTAAWVVLSDAESLAFIAPTRTYEYTIATDSWSRVMSTTQNTIRVKNLTSEIPEDVLDEAMELLMYRLVDKVCVIKPEPEAFYFLSILDKDILNFDKDTFSPKESEPKQKRVFEKNIAYLDEEE